MELESITRAVWMLRFPVVNAYLVRVDQGFATIDSGPLGSEGEILAAIDELGSARGLEHIVLTHSHKDHAGSAAALVAATGAVVMAGAADAPVIAGRAPEPAAVITAEEQPFFDKIADVVPPAPPVEVDRVLHDGDDLGWDSPAVVLAIPGHTAGSIAIHLPTERVLFAGDAVASVGGRPILGPFNMARQAAISAFKRLAALDVEIACFGHGDPIVGDAKNALRRAASQH
jgi:glyoxylase-like metal-dependent hydrolase (beta-lactamase superfamily II)